MAGVRRKALCWWTNCLDTIWTWVVFFHSERSENQQVFKVSFHVLQAHFHVVRNQLHILPQLLWMGMMPTVQFLFIFFFPLCGMSHFPGLREQRLCEAQKMSFLCFMCSKKRFRIEACHISLVTTFHVHGHPCGMPCAITYTFIGEKHAHAPVKITMTALLIYETASLVKLGFWPSSWESAATLTLRATSQFHALVLQLHHLLGTTGFG